MKAEVDLRDKTEAICLELNDFMEAGKERLTRDTTRGTPPGPKFRD